jgi:hypothetical protein
MRKKRILFQTDAALAKTGFGRTAKALLTYLYKTGKYDITHYCLGINYSHPSLHRTPWKTIGCLPDDPAVQKQIQQDPGYARQVNYGAYYIDKVIKDIKPDVYFAIQDIWGVDFAIDKPWFKELTSVIWTTLDSLPILPTAINKAKKIDNYWIWSDFATRALHELGHEHVKTVHGPVDCKYFKKLPDQDKVNLRLKFQQYLPVDSFVTGFVFRNQLRKSVPNLLEGYALFKKKLPKGQSTRLLLHTSWSEGWNIWQLAEEYKIDKADILTTYVCRVCKQYGIAPFYGEKRDCPFCGTKEGVSTTNTAGGVYEEQLNEIYNLMDVYCHPFTSGGQEIPIQEAKLTELITLVTNYSCGEEMCSPEAASLPLEWSEYREHNTNFRKASTDPQSIAKQLYKVFKMKHEKRTKMGVQARQFVLNEYSCEKIGNFVSEFIDSAPFCDFDFSKDEEEKEPFAKIPEEENDGAWILSLYKLILKMEYIDETDEGYVYWMKELEGGKSRDSILQYFRKTALTESEKGVEEMFDEYLAKDDEGKRIIYVMPGAIGDIYMSTSLFRSIKEIYPEYNLYVAAQKEFHELLDGNEHIHGILPYMKEMDHIFFLEGNGDHKGWFEIAFIPFVCTQRYITYTHNGKDKIAYKDLAYEN